MARTINQHHYKNMALCEWHIRATNRNNLISNYGPQKAFKAHVYPSRVHKFTPVFSLVRVVQSLVIYVVYCRLLSVFLAIVLPITASDYSFGVFKLFTCKYTYKTQEKFSNSTVILYTICVDILIGTPLTRDDGPLFFIIIFILIFKTVSRWVGETRFYL